MHDQPADRALGVLDREQQLVGGRVADLALVADLAAAFGVEGGPVQHQLGGSARLDTQLRLRAGLQLLVAGAVADDGRRPVPSAVVDS